MITQTVYEMCKNCYDRFWAFEEPVMHCIVCGDSHGYTMEVVE